VRVFGKVLWGIGGVLALYFCVDGLMFGAKKDRPPAHARSSARETEPETARPGELPRVPPAVKRERPPSAPSSGAAPAEHPQSDESPALAATLEGEYATDARPTHESYGKEATIGKFFSVPELQGKGQLREVKCKEKICRGVIRIASEDSDNEVFSRTFLSTEFMTAVPDAISVASREKMADGSVLATFYIHPQSVFAMLPQTPEE
jgi:hypothetical protein